jgi:putative DNA primase/helicase
MNAAAIPTELKAKPRWLVWKGQLTEKGKLTKVPYQATDPTQKASSTDPTTWTDFDTAQEAVIAREADGAGYALGDGTVGADLDKCIDPVTGTLEPWAQEIIQALASYTEYSPSGRGVHILAKGSLPPHGRKKGPVEMYDSGRFFTITGRRVPGTPPTVEERTSALHCVHEKVFGPQGKKAPAQPPLVDERDPSQPDEPTESDAGLIERAKAAKNGAKFIKLWSGDWSDYSSQSEADLALCHILAFWTNRAGQRIDRLFRQSGLMREKWDQPHYAGGETYGAHTVALALDGQPTTTSSAANHHPADLTDIGNARRFVELHHDVRYDHTRRRWYLYRPEHWWEPDRTGEVHERAKAVVYDRFHTALECTDDSRRAGLVRWAVRSAQHERIKAMLALASNDPAVAILGDAWNPDPLLLGVANGVVDLRTGRFRPGLPEDLITRASTVSFNADATCPRWERFLLEIFSGDTQLVQYIQRALGYSLTARTSEQVLFLNYGTGANGKTTLFNAIQSVLGHYALNLPFTALEKRRGGSIPNDLAMLPGARFVTASETNEGTRLNEGLIKALTGCDPITARFLYGEFFTFQPVAKFWLAVNHKPGVQDDTHGFWRRIHLIPYTQQFPPDDRLSGQLLAEREGILRWLVEGALLWQRDGLTPPESVLAATKNYQQESDLVGQFVEERCALDSSATARANLLYLAFTSWCEAQGIGSGSPDRLSGKAFGSRMSARFDKDHDREGCFYKGISLVVNAEPVTPDFGGVDS